MDISKTYQKHGVENITRETPGPNGIAKTVKTEVDAFLLFFDKEMFNTVVVERTNRCMQRNRVRSQKIDAATEDTDTMEIKALFGLILFCGILHGCKTPMQATLWIICCQTNLRHA